jgi:CRISPR system Cascade subunit CasD
MKYVLLWLEGPLQSWGYDSRYGRRESLNFPTKSGVLGIILAAMGAGGEQRELLSDLSQYRHTVLSYVRTASSSPVQLRDFHMVGSGYDTSDKWQNLLVPKTEDGKSSVGGGSKITHRAYIQDGAFAVVVEADDQMASRIAAAIQDPVWDISLGRKSCPPSDIVLRGVFENSESACTFADEIAQEKNRQKGFIVYDEVHSDGEQLTLSDVPVQFGIKKLYQDRTVTVVSVI